MNESCGAERKAGEITEPGYEIAHVEKTRNVCPMCETYAKRQGSKPVAVMCCEGACLRGEVARQAANLLCHSLAPDQTVRICLGGAFTKDTGQRNLVRNAPRVIALEGCFLNCSSRMMRGVVGDLELEIVIADQLYDFDRSLFGIDEMPRAEIEGHGRGREGCRPAPGILVILCHLAVLIGIPMYSNAAGIIPVVQALLGKGAAPGTVLGFKMAVIGPSLPETIILRKVLRPRLIATFIAVVGVGILLVGYLLSLLPTQEIVTTSRAIS